MKIKTNINSSYTLGQVMQQGRLQTGMSQRELAKAIGVSQKWIWEMEQGKPGLLMNRLFRILSLIEVELFAEIIVKDKIINEEA